MMSKSPVKAAFLPIFESFSGIKTSLSPTNTIPKKTKIIPIHSLESNFRFKNPIDKSPVKIITAPRNIWKLPALVKVKPTYIMEVASISQAEGANRIIGLNVRFPFVKLLESAEPF